jgi:capsular polysaccharide biosynthesis protein
MTTHELKESESDSEISLLDILIFLKGAWKTIASAMILGLVVSNLYLLFTPNQYEAVANIQMARIPARNNTGGTIEEPAALIARMSLPNSLDSVVMSSCGMENQPDAVTKLSKVVMLTIPKGVASVVELKVTLPTPELANACAASMVNLISKSQAQKISIVQDANQTQLDKVNVILSEDKILLTKAHQPGSPISPTYFALLSEIRGLEDQREKLLNLVDSKQLQESIQQVSIYGVDKPIYPKKAVSLLMGALGGLFLGILIALVRQMIAKLKAESQGAL